MAIHDAPGENRLHPMCSNLHDAANIIKRNLLFDRESIDLSDQLNVSSIYSGVCSGLREDDYPLIEGVQIPLLTDVRRVPLPPELVEQFGHMQCNCLMGVFPEIGRAWLTVDSDIFVWRYTDGDDLAYFDGLAETILSVSLVQPKTGIFRDHIKYLLVLTTPLDVVLLGVSFANDDINNEMHLLPDPLFTISSDNSYLLHTVGTINGRIFTGGKDGCLYEINYQAKRGWFSRSCVKVNHSRSRLSFLFPSLVHMWLNVEDSINQLCVDDTRNILYTLSEKGTISVYDLGENGLSTSCVAHIRLDSIQRKARDIASGIEPSNLNQLVHIAPITRHESRHMHLVAITQAGVRLYFITCQSNVLSTATTTSTHVHTHTPNISKLRPTGIYLVHVRLPPGFTGNSLQRPTLVHAAHYNSGTLLLSSTNGDDGVFWCVSKDTYAFSKSNFSLDGRAWAIAEVACPQTESVAAVLPFGSMAPIPPDPSIQVIQHVQKPSEYVVITSQGCHMFSKMRPVDQLRYLLDNTPDPECQAVEAFFRLYDNGEAACCCIILAMSGVPTDIHLAERAVMALVLYGGIPTRHHYPFNLQGNAAPPNSLPGYSGGPMSPIPMASQQQHVPQTTSIMRTSNGSTNGMPVISTPMPGYHPPSSFPQTPGAVPNLPSTPSATTPSSLQSNVADPYASLPVMYYSERQHGVFKMFSRITRPLWEGRLVQDLVVEEDGKRKTFVVGRLDVEVVSATLDQLNSLKMFVGKHCLTPVQMRDLSQQPRDHDVTNRSFLVHHQMPSLHNDQHRSQMAEIARAELTSMKCIYELLVRSCEVLGLWRIILHHQIHVLFEAFDKQCQTTLKTITFQDLVLSGEVTCASMVSTLINQFMDDNVTVDALNSQLRETCPSLYSADDAICSKATELLHLARKSSVTLKDDNLQRASQLFQQIASTVNLSSAIQQFQSVRCYTEAVELCIKSARAKDPNGIALKLYHSGLSANDSQIDAVIRKCYLDRMECYKYITDILDELTDISAYPPQAPSIPLGPGPPQPSRSVSSTDPRTPNPEEAQSFADDCLQLAIRSDDELLHVTVYEWLLRKDLSSKLLQINSPYIESFLRRLADSRDNVLSSSHLGIDLLWKHHERSGQHLLAAEVLTSLAEKPGSDRDLNKRIEYLSRAKVNAKSVTSAVADSAAGGALLHEIEEKIEVAQIQLETLEFLKELNESDAVNRLHSGLYDVTTLYSEFAEPYQLAESKLAIAHCSSLHDVGLIKSLWKNIIDYELQKSVSMPETGKAAALKRKVIQLSKRYSSSHRYFPVEYLTIFLEKLACSKDWDIDWVFTCMLEAGVSIYDLLDIYVKTHSHKLSHWPSLSKPHHLLSVENELIRVFIEKPAAYMPSVPNRRRFVNHLLDVLATHLVELQSITSPSDGVLELISHFRRDQADLTAMQERQR